MVPKPVDGGCRSPACEEPNKPTPQVREGPIGPKTMCNACGVHWVRVTKGMSPAKKGAYIRAACQVYYCYKSSPEHAAGQRLSREELDRRTKALADAMYIPVPVPKPAPAPTPAPAPVPAPVPSPAPEEAPGTPPLAAAGGAAPEWSDAGSQEEEELAQMGQFEMQMAAAQVALHSPSTLNLKRSVEQFSEEEYSEEDYTPLTSTPKRARTGPRAPRQELQQTMDFLAHALGGGAGTTAAAGGCGMDEEAVTGAEMLFDLSGGRLGSDRLVGGAFEEEEGTAMEVEVEDDSAAPGGSTAAAGGGDGGGRRWMDEETLRGAEMVFDFSHGRLFVQQQGANLSVHTTQGNKRGRGDDTTAAAGGGSGAVTTRSSKKLKTEAGSDTEGAFAGVGAAGMMLGGHQVFGAGGVMGVPQQVVGGGVAAGGAGAAGQDVEMAPAEGVQQQQQGQQGGGGEGGVVFVVAPQVAGGVRRSGRGRVQTKKYSEYDTTSSEEGC